MAGFRCVGRARISLCSCCQASWQQSRLRRSCSSVPSISQQTAHSRAASLRCSAQNNRRSPRAESPADALVKSLGELSATEGRVAKSTSIVLGAEDSLEKWRELDEKVNEYPGQRTFKAIGSGGNDFVSSMVSKVGSVVGTVHEECIQQRLSGKGNYISVTVGPVWVENSEQVIAIFAAMRQDERLRWYL